MLNFIFVDKKSYPECWPTLLLALVLALVRHYQALRGATQL